MTNNNTTIRCQICNKELVNANHSTAPTPDWQHRHTADHDHRATPRP